MTDDILKPGAGGGAKSPDALVVAVRVTALAARVWEFARRRGWAGTVARDKGARQLKVHVRALARAGMSFEEVEARWAWYEARIDTHPSLPRILDAKDLARPKVWAWLDREYEKSLRTGSSVRRSEGVSLSPEAEEVLRGLGDRHWGRGADDLLPEAVEQSARNLKEYVGRLDAARLEGDDVLLRDELSFRIGEVENFLVNWFDRVWRSKHNWSDWSGDLMRHVWTPTHQDFYRYAADVLGDYGGPAADWRGMLERVGNPDAAG